MTAKTIIVGVDGSKSTPRVLDAATAFAERIAAEIVLVTAAEDLAAAESAQAECPVDAERVLQVGKPWRVLCDVAKKRRAAAVVVGAHSYGSVERVLGTTAASVVNHAEMPVLVARGPLSFERILVAHDGSKRASSVLSNALRLLTPVEGELVLVRAIEPIFRAPFGPAIDVHAIEQLLVEDVSASAPLGRTLVRAGVGDAWKVVLAEAKTSRSSLIVLGAHGYQPIERALGTTAARVVNHADRCVLVVKDEAPVVAAPRMAAAR